MCEISIHVQSEPCSLVLQNALNFSRVCKYLNVIQSLSVNSALIIQDTHVFKSADNKGCCYPSKKTNLQT